MAATGKTPILLYGSTTATNAPVAGNLTNSSDGCEIAINVADKNLFFKDSGNVVNTVPIRQSSASSNGWLSSTDWSTFNSKQPAGTYVTSVTGTAPVVSSGGTTPAISMAAASGSTNGYLTSTDWTTFNSKQPAGSYALTTGTLAQFASTTSAQLAGVISDETGTGFLVFSSNPTLDGGTNSTHVTVGDTRKVAMSTSANSIYNDAWFTFAYNSSVGGYKFTNTLNTLLTLDLGGDVSVNTGNLVIGTSGKGIDFSATPQPAGMTSELLADYEEGTFTPAIVGGSTAGTGTYTTQIGRYTKIGREVFFNIVLVWTAHTGSGTSSYISGLPYTSVNVTGNDEPVKLNCSNYALTAANVMTGYVGYSSTNIILQQMPTGGGAIASLSLDTAASVWISGSYSVT